MEEKAALEYLVETGKKLCEPIERDYDGRKYINKELKPMESPLVSALKISTLGSLIDLCKGQFGKETEFAFEGFDAKRHILHVVDEDQVQVVGALSNAWAKREVLIVCQNEERPSFTFGQYLNHEQFIVGLLSLFKQTGDREYLLKIASNVTTEKVFTSADDGISQGVALKAGVTLQRQEVIRSRVKLAPFRTFREVEQPISEFIFRVRQDENQLPKLALFEGDGGAWALEARENIARFLSAGIAEAVVAS